MLREADEADNVWRRAGVYLYAAGSIGTGLADLWWQEFERAHEPIQALSDGLAGNKLLACAAALWLIAGGTALLFRRSAKWGAGALAAIYMLFALFWIPRLYTAPRFLGYRAAVYISLLVGVGQQLILVAAAAVLVLWEKGEDAEQQRRRGAWMAVRWMVGLCLIDFGLAHVTGQQEVAAMVPRALPGGGAFWAVVTGIAFMAAGLGVVTKVKDVMAAQLTGLMLLVFSGLVLAPAVFAQPHNHIPWGSNAYNLAAAGALWIVAEGLRGRQAQAASV